MVPVIGGQHCPFLLPRRLLLDGLAIAATPTAMARVILLTMRRRRRRKGTKLTTMIARITGLILF